MIAVERSMDEKMVEKRKNVFLDASLGALSRAVSQISARRRCVCHSL